MVEARLRLLLAEIEYERLRLLRLLVLAVLGAGSIVACLFATVAFLVLIAPPEDRPLVLLIIVGIFLLLGIVCLGIALSGHRKRQPFEASRDALKKDCECLASLNRN